MKVVFEPKLGLEISIAEDGDICLTQDSNKVFINIGQMRGLMKKMPDLLKEADLKRADYLNQREVR